MIYAATQGKRRNFGYQQMDVMIEESVLICKEPYRKKNFKSLYTVLAKVKLALFCAKQEGFSLKKLKYWDSGKKAGK